MPEIDGEQHLRDQWKLSADEVYRREEAARKEGRTVGLILGFLLGAIGLPVGCSLLPDHFRHALSQTFQSDGSEQM